jgi:ABC-type transport system involved in cytochrome bd biosynthesis fused ATPase/permease subunit
MRKPLLLSFLMALIPVIYMAKFSLNSAVVTAVIVILSLLSNELIQRRRSSRLLGDEPHRRLSEKVRALVERDLESELFNLSSQVEEELKRDLEEISADKGISTRSFDLIKVIPALLFFSNALILFSLNKDLDLLEAHFAIASMVVLAHLGAITSTPPSKNLR